MTDKPNPDEAARQLQTSPATTLDGALGPNWQAWQDHVAAHVQLPDADADGDADPAPVITVPMLMYGDGPNDYIATHVGDGRVAIQDGNDATGKTWQYPQDQFMRFVAHAQGKTLDGDDEPERGDNPLVAAAKQQERTNRLVQADRDATADAEKTADSKARKTGR